MLGARDGVSGNSRETVQPAAGGSVYSYRLLLPITGHPGHRPVCRHPSSHSQLIPHYLHTIYTLSTHYLHIYTVAGGKVGGVVSENVFTRELLDWDAGEDGSNTPRINTV